MSVQKTRNIGGKQVNQKMSSSAVAAALESDEGSSASSSEDEQEEVKKDIWKGHYSSAHKLLLVGEGDFSFSLCLARAFGSARNIVATTVETQQELVKKYGSASDNLRELEERGAVVLCGVDATAMANHFFLTTQRFNRIVYNFPHVGFRFPEDNGCQIKMNKDLVKGFLKNAKMLLKKENGEIHVSHKIGEPYDKWNLVKTAKKIDLAVCDKTRFSKNMYRGYEPKRAHGAFADTAFKLGESVTFKFKLSECP